MPNQITGFETTSTAVSYALYEMAQNHEIQTKLRNELTEALNSSDNFSYETLLELKYLNKIVSETLRKYPTIPMTMRKCTSSYRIPDTQLDIPAGVTVLVPILAIHHDPLYYPDPSAFDPERFADESARSQPAYTYLPFGEGARNCVVS
jgi:cytochrome P450 family 6